MADLKISQLDALGVGEFIHATDDYMPSTRGLGNGKYNLTQLAASLSEHGLISGGLPIQAVDLVVSVTSDAEFVTAMDNYWNYQFTVSARYIIQFATGYVISTQITIEKKFMPNLVIRSQTTTDVDCSGFVPNALGMKSPFYFINCRIAAFYGTFTSSNGSTTFPMLILGATMDFWSGNVLAPTALNMSGFNLIGSNGGMKIFGWTEITPNVVGTTITLDCHIDIQNTNLRGVKLKVGNGESSFTSCSGDFQLETTAGTTGRVLSHRSNLTMTLNHSTTANFSFGVGQAGNIDIFLFSGNSFTPYSTVGNIFQAEGNTSMQVYFLSNSTWHPQTSTDVFVRTGSGGSFSAYGGSLTINTGVATPNFVMSIGIGSIIKHSFTNDFAEFPNGPYTEDGSNPMIEGEVTPKGALVISRRSYENDEGFLTEIATEAGTSTPIYVPSSNILITPPSNLSATTIDLTNYRKQGSVVRVSFRGFTISNITWSGAIFIGAPARASIGDYVEFEYSALTDTFHRIGSIEVSPISPVTTINSVAGVLTIDLLKGKYFQTTLFENVTSIVITNPPPSGYGDTFLLWITQDAVSARTVTMPASFDWEGGTVGSVSTALGAVDILSGSTRNGTSFDVTLSKGRA